MQPQASLEFDQGERDFLHNNVRVGRIVELPNFDFHSVEESLLVNHRQFNGVALTREEAQAAIRQYRIFLRKHKSAGMPDKFESPGLLIDRVWHTHICETQQYADDCHAYFGKFFHHASLLCEGGADPR